MAEPNWENQTIWTGDNLPIMRGMNSDSVDLIYLDPPFNSKANYAAPIGSAAAGAEFKDTWTLTDVDAEWINLIEAKHPKLHRVLLAAMTDSDKSYLAYMAVRLLEMHRLLKPTGSIYLHCDPTMSAHLRLVMDAIFGKKNFRNEIVWQRTNNHSDAGRFGRICDRLFFYGTNIRKNNVKIPLADSYITSKYRRKDERGQYQDVSLTGPGTTAGEAGETWEGWNPTDIGRHWSVPKTGDYARWIEENIVPRYRKEPSVIARLNMLRAANLIVFTSSGTPRLKRYLEASKQVPPDLWTDIPPVNSQAKERTDYPTQKPLDLVRRIIKASSDYDAMVLDPFCGCATACIAAEIERRHWIGIDVSAKAAELVEKRMEKELQLLYQGAHRTDIPRRTDLGKLRRYSSPENRKLLYGEQAGNCAGVRHALREAASRDRPHHRAQQGRHRPPREPPAALLVLQPHQGQPRHGVPARQAAAVARPQSAHSRF